MRGSITGRLLGDGRVFTSGLLALFVSVAPAACASTNTNLPQHPQIAAQTVPEASFNLKAISELLRTNQVRDIRELEIRINNDRSLNSLDLNHTGNIDIITINERRDHDTVILDFMDGNQLVGTLSLTPQKSNNTVVISGGYYDEPQVVYVVTPWVPAYGSVVFFSWLFTPYRPFYVPHYYYNFYRPGPWPHPYGHVLVPRGGFRGFGRGGFRR